MWTSFVGSTPDTSRGRPLHLTMAAPWMADSNPSDAMSLPSGELWRSSTITISCVSAPMAAPATTPAVMANTHARWCWARSW